MKIIIFLLALLLGGTSYAEDLQFLDTTNTTSGEMEASDVGSTPNAYITFRQDGKMEFYDGKKVGEIDFNNDWVYVSGDFRKMSEIFKKSFENIK